MTNSRPIETALSCSKDARLRWRIVVLVALTMSLFVAAPAALSAVPGEVNYQGLLLDDLGVPVDGTADFEFRLFDIETAGSALWTEVHLTVSVVDGVYDVALGSITPISESIFSAGTLYLEVDIDGETLSPRQRLLAVPYALRAAVAEETDNVAGISSAYFEAILVAAPWDGSLPGNFDPREGLADPDGDSVPNFMDRDNDGDGLSDEMELSAGSDINVKTPNLVSIAPNMVRDDLPSVVTVFGTNFEASMTVQIGAEVGALSNITPTSVDVSLGVHPVAIEDVVVTLSNGQSDSLVGGIEFFVLVPVLSSVFPLQLPEGTPAIVTISGANFETSMIVQIGSEIGVLSNVTPTSADVSIGGHASAVEDVTVTLSNTQSATLVNAITFGGNRIFFVTSSTHTGDLGGIVAADAICNVRASEGGLPGSYQAWLSDGAESPATRSTRSGIPYVDTSGGTLATSWVAHMSPGMGNVRRDENGVDIGSSKRSWTNVDDLTLDSAGTSHCSGWTSTSGNGAHGITGVTGFNWTNSTTPVSCTTSGHLYCIGQ